ncbi:hypothetical protein [Absidia glauca]|uniref:DUF202 domain-containing protein n=1 Tax=Absidia glauca TaxID=4829 RepID=A0A163KN42_ABSGL|nr:hypothetical protein [Absidia glauca]
MGCIVNVFFFNQAVGAIEPSWHSNKRSNTTLMIDLCTQRQQYTEYTEKNGGLLNLESSDTFTASMALSDSNNSSNDESIANTLHSKYRQPPLLHPMTIHKEQQQQPPHGETTRCLLKCRKRRLCSWIDQGYQALSFSILLENTSSVARDHLANERTFLAWLRTSLALITVGVAITQLYQLNPARTDTIGRALGATFVGLSIVFLYIGNARYFHCQYALTQGFFPASRGAVVLGSICVLPVLLAMFVVIVTE